MQETISIEGGSNNCESSTNNQIQEESAQNENRFEEQGFDYINSDMIDCENSYRQIDVDNYGDMQLQKYNYGYEINYDEDSSLNSIKYQEKSFESISEDNSDYSQKSKKQPLKVLRKTGMIEINRHIDIQLNIMLLGDIFIHKDIFVDSRDNKLSNVCPVSAYRPVIATEKTEKYCLAFVDNSQMGITDINFPIQLLASLNYDKAYRISQNLAQLYNFYQNLQTLQQKVFSYYRNDHSKIEHIIYNNHQQSLKLAQNYLKRITQDKIIMFHYKKIDPSTLTHKLHYTGSNMTMSELFTGKSDFSVLEQYMNRIGTPRYIDAQGMVNLIDAKFQGNTTFDLNLITLDDLIIPLNCSIKRIFLNEFEIVPGEKMSEYLDIHILDANLNIIQDVLAKRNQPTQVQNVSQLEYEMKAEIFLQKFYQEENRDLQQGVFA
ncbi:hypothetical protein TTHERM_00469200 (macronuclear) [Tetrahymena thermophila SB210]|uniref:Uncharacterized protein n=1 Tax=Tetrahymena thermophila (strain SB210) TaxID=312017 RepID=I7MMH6_TETTS|nr:hypothetical protein TTHERM_00469200 [Tetrahymena thermophila SB210]EAS04871.1 hypothetical protein TTHERM_00469200 [Tetrahymena thermophila SB210]|eukprot:XP_001025116.1 hypothetical protein TTHERM_00469200 [Tetrahymena thermophila SB210]